MSDITEYEQRHIAAAAQNGFASEEAERSMLGNIVGRNDEYGHYADELTEDDFYASSRRMIFRAIRKAKAEGLAIDLVTIGGMIEKVDPDNAGTITSELIQCAQSYSSAFNAESYYRIIKELSVRRRAILLVGDIQTQLNDPTQGINGIMDKLRTNAGDLLVNKHSWVSIQDVLFHTLDYIEKRVKGDVKSIATGIPNVDAIIGGFFGGEMTVIGARPGVGKSVFGMNVAIAAAEKGFKVGICSREMTDVQYGQRIVSYESYVDGMKIRKAQLDDDDWMKIVEGTGLGARLPIEFLFTVRSVEDLRAEVQRKVAKGELDMLVVDYLQLMTVEQRFKEDRLRVGYISKALKDISTDFNIPVIALAQVKRYAGGTRAKMPTLEDLKDSGSIEQDADNVIFLHNPYNAEDEYVDPRDKEYFDSFAEHGLTYLCLGVAKQRQGVTGVACILFNKANMRYYAIDRTHG